MPDCDMDWLRGVDMDEAPVLTEKEESRLLEVREYQFGCDCTLRRIVRAITALQSGEVEELFGDDEHLRITCPRCGAKYQASREDLQ